MTIQIHCGTSILDAMAYFLKYKQIRHGSPQSTIVSYRSILHEFSRLAMVDTVSDITIEVVDVYCFNISLRGLSPKTVHNKIAVVRSFIRFLYGKNLVDIRPESIDIPRAQPAERTFLNEPEQARLIQAAKNIRDRAILLLFISSGLRVSELAGLKVSDINGRCITIRNGKGYKPRLSFMTPETQAAIKIYRGSLPYESEYVFCNKFGHSLSRQYIRNIVFQCSERAKLNKKVTPHTLRRSFATNLLQKGMRIEELQPIMGHSSILTTRAYTELANSHLQSVYDRTLMVAS